MAPGNGRPKRVALVGCGRRKLDRPAPAEELYISRRFSLAREFALGTGDAWAVLSAKHHILMPTTLVEPYDLDLRDLSALEQDNWSSRAAAMYLRFFPGPTVAMLVAEDLYTEQLAKLLEWHGVDCQRPLAGLAYSEHEDWLATAVEDMNRSRSAQQTIS